MNAIGQLGAGTGNLCTAKNYNLPTTLENSENVIGQADNLERGILNLISELNRRNEEESNAATEAPKPVHPLLNQIDDNLDRIRDSVERSNSLIAQISAMLLG